MRDTQMSGKTSLVTGATSGIGAVTARALAEMGSTVIVVGRDRAKSEATVQRIIRETGNESVEYLLADLSSQEQIRRLAEQVKGRYDQLNVLVNNAGGMFLRRQESVDGIEMTFALNHLGYFLLTNLLLDELKRGVPSRIVNVSSRAHEGARIDFEDLEGRRSYGGMRAYGQSKLANLLFTYELARRLEGSGVTVNALHPGFVATSFGANNGGSIVRALVRLAQRRAISPEEGAQTSIYLASSPEVEGVSGGYFVRRAPHPSSPASRDQEAARRLWEVSLQMVRLPVPA
jgi:NAD(P)-dependent dehydrogenase (short-subunit alcohol dehydrogenase family)